MSPLLDMGSGAAWDRGVKIALDRFNRRRAAEKAAIVDNSANAVDAPKPWSSVGFDVETDVPFTRRPAGPR